MSDDQKKICKSSPYTQQYYKDYYLKNKDTIKLQKKIYYQENKEIVADKYKIYYEKHKKHIIKHQMEYYQNNKVEISKRIKQKKHCSLCDCSIIKHNFKKHEQSRKHKELIIYKNLALNL